MWLIVAAVLAVLLAIKYALRRTVPETRLGTWSTTQDKDVKASTKKVIVVVGGNGFFGSYLLENILLQNKFDEIRVFDIANTSLPSHPMIKFVKGSVTNLDDCLRALDGALAVLHIAAIVDVRETTFYRNFSWHVNVGGTWNIVEASIRRGVKALVYTSTNATVYTGQPGVKPQNEADVLKLWAETKAVSSYGISKRKATQLVLSSDKRGGLLRSASLMPGLILGPREPRMLATILYGAPVILAPPEHCGNLNFCDATSTAKAHLLAIDRLLENDDRVGGHVFMMSDFIDNVMIFEQVLRKALNKPATRVLGWPLVYGMTCVSVFLNWLTNDRYNINFFQLTFTSAKMIQYGPVYQSTHEAQQALGWKPVTQESLVEELVKYYNVKQ